MSPLTEKGEKIMKKMHKKYGAEKGHEVFYASKNKGTIKGVEGSSKKKKIKKSAGKKKVEMMDLSEHPSRRMMQ